MLFSYRFYNQDLLPGCLLIEVGGHGNNLNEALYAGQLAADINAWNTRFGGSVTIWYSYTLAEVTGTSTTLGAPAAQLGIQNLLVRVPSSSTLSDDERAALVQSQLEAGVEHVVVRDDAAGSFE